MRLTLVVCALPLLAARWTVDDILLAERASQLEISRDSRYVAWVKSQMDKDKGESVSNLVLRNLAEDWEIPLTRGKDNHSLPSFSPDSKKIAYLSSRKPSDRPAPADADSQGMQVWLVDIHGGEAHPVTTFAKGVRVFRWIDNTTLLVAAPEDATLYDQQIKDKKDTSTVVEDERHATPVRLFKVDINSRNATRLTTNTDRIQGLVVSDDGHWAVTVHERSLRYIYDQKIRPVTFLHDLAKGSSTQLFNDGKLLPRQITFRGDHAGFYFAAPYTSHPRYNNAAIDKLYFYDISAARATEIPIDWPNGLGGPFAVTSNGFVALLANGVRHKAAVYYPSANGNWSRSWIEGEHASNLFGL